MFDLLAIRLPRLLAGGLLLVGIGINFANVAGRYLFSAPIFWAEEAMIFLVLWAVFLAFVSVTAAQAHLRMDLFSAALPARPGRLLARLSAAIVFLVTAFVALQSLETVERLWRFGSRSISLDIPMVVPHGALLVGFGLAAAASLYLLVRGRE